MMDFTSIRAAMVKRQIKGRGVTDQHVLDAMNSVPREAFIAREAHKNAYDDNPLPIGADQTISQPFIVAFMVEALALNGGEKVLEIGTGSGYAAAILAEIAGDVFTVERIEELADRAAETLRALNYSNIHVQCHDGTLGWLENAPYDAIIVAAASPRVPESLKAQLSIGGRLVIPIGATGSGQELVRLTRVAKTNYKTEIIADVRFVPLIGDEGWKAKEDFRSNIDRR